LQPGLRVGSDLALTDFRSDNPKWTLAYEAAYRSCSGAFVSQRERAYSL